MNRGEPWVLNLGELIRRRHAAAKPISANRFAHSIGIHPYVLLKIEQDMGCSVNVLIDIHKATGIPYETLLEGG